MGIYSEGKLYLNQEKEILKHINMDVVMNFINKLHKTRRMERDIDIPKLQKLNKQYLKYPKDAYGLDGEYFYHDENYYTESIGDYNNPGPNPSLWLPFYIEKENDNYVLKANERMKGNDFDSIKLWMIFLHENIFYQLGIETKGQFTFYNDEKDTKFRIKLDENGMQSKMPDKKLFNAINKKEFLQECENYERVKNFYFPKLFQYISEEIEQNNQLKNNYSFEP